MSTTEEPTPAPEPENEGPVGDESPMDGDNVRGPDGEELEWPQPKEDDGEEHGESLDNDGTPGAAAEKEE
jgi:hypothetical protein